MKTLGLIRIIVAASATAAAVVTLAFAATAAQAARQPAITWSPVTSPGTFDYGDVDLGQGASQTFALTNSGQAATGMLRVSLASASEFSITADACTGTALGPRKSCNVTVQYAPTTAGQTTATLAANGKKPPSSASITLAGTGAAVAVRHIYWANYGLNTIARADLDGLNGSRASSPARPSPSTWRSTPSTSTGPTSTSTRSAGPTSTARTRTRASSPARSPPWRGGGPLV